MKTKYILINYLLFFIALSCSSNDNNDDEPQTNFFNNAYLEIYFTDGTNCVADLFLTSGTASLTSDNEIRPNTDNSNYVVFNEIDMINCEFSNPNIKTFDLQNGVDSQINTTFIPDVFYDITYNSSGNIQSANEYYLNQMNITLAELTIISNNQLRFEIHYENGTILSETYSGEIEVFEVY